LQFCGFVGCTSGDPRTEPEIKKKRKQSASATALAVTLVAAVMVICITQHFFR
jgi:hypothetical protein